MTDYSVEPSELGWVADAILSGKHLGKGGLCNVYGVKNPDTQQMYALKAVKPDLAAIPLVLARFALEQKAMKDLSHQNIPGAYQGGTMTAICSNGNIARTPFFLMDYLTGQDLEEVIVERRGGDQYLPIADVIAIGIAVAGVLAYVHRQGYVHRDVKPGNLMFSTPTKDPKDVAVIDFGLCHPKGEPLFEEEESLMVGTSHYAPPENFGATTSIDPAKDIYSLGITMYHLVTGHLPFEGSNSIAALSYAHRHHNPVPIGRLRGDVPDWLGLVVSKAMEKKPGKRFRSMEAMQEALRNLPPIRVSDRLERLVARAWKSVYRPFT